MNDFTAAELRLMYALINELILYSTQPPCVHELKEKVKNMSINYCEHDWENICCQCSLDKIYCYKCEKTFDEVNK